MTHELKTWPEYFEEITAGGKSFEVRKNDRNFKKGDTLVLKEFDPKTSQYSGRKVSIKTPYILYGGQFGIEEGYCVMSLL